MQAEQLGIEVDGRWSEKRLREEIAKASPEVEDAPVVEETVESPEVEDKPFTGVTIKNMRKNRIGQLGIEGGCLLVLTDAQLADVKLMKRIRHGVATGVLEIYE